MSDLDSERVEEVFVVAAKCRRHEIEYIREIVVVVVVAAAVALPEAIASIGPPSQTRSRCRSSRRWLVLDVCCIMERNIAVIVADAAMTMVRRFCSRCFESRRGGC